jgi:hypothetical protein
MSETKHTPGPWMVEPVFIAQQTCGALHFGEYRFPFKRNGDGSCFTYSREEAEANARLIAAAPEMLAALKSINEWLLFGEILSNPNDVYLKQFITANNLAVAAIAKAEGK